MCHREDETHLWKKLSTLDFVRENLEALQQQGIHQSSVSSSLLQGLLPVPPVNVPAQTHAGDPAVPCGHLRTALQEAYPRGLLAPCQLDRSCILWQFIVGHSLLWLSSLSFWVARQMKGLWLWTFLLSDRYTYGQAWSQRVAIGCSAVGCAVLAAWCK